MTSPILARTIVHIGFFSRQYESHCTYDSPEEAKAARDGYRARGHRPTVAHWLGDENDLARWGDLGWPGLEQILTPAP